MRLIAILSLATLLVGMIGCSASPEADPTENPGSAQGSPPAPPIPNDLVALVLQTPVAKRVVGPGPAVMTMEEAREILPFPIETPEYLPRGFVPEKVVSVTLQPPAGGQPAPDTAWRPVGVTFRYIPISPTPGDRQRFIMVEQSLLNGKPKVVSGEKKVVPIGRHFADVWQTDNLDGQTFILAAWDEISYGTATLVMSTEDEEETLEVASSFQ